MQNSRLDQAQIYTEFNGLNALKTQARSDSKGALEQVAKQFESLFLAEMLKSMRAANKVLSEGSYLNSSQSEFYQDMFDSQLSLSMSKDQGLGLADTLVRQLSQQIPGMSEKGEPLSGHRRSISDYDRSLPSLSPALPKELDRVKEVIRTTSDALQTGEVTGKAPIRFDSPQAFVSHMMPMAEAVAEESGISAQLMVAQAALETGWGKHMIEGKQGEPSFNLFGIKADSRWRGESVGIATTEYREGVPMKERAAFRSYDDFEASFRDYVDFLKTNPRYRDVLASADDPDVFADKLQAAGYATDPAYGQKIRQIMDRDFLQPTSASASVSPYRASGE